LQIKAAGWPSADEIDACNGDFVVAITQIIAEITISAENHLNLPKNLFGLNSKQLDIKKWEKVWVLYPYCPLQTHWRRRKRGALGVAAAMAVARNRRCGRRRGGGGSRLTQFIYVYHIYINAIRAAATSSLARCSKSPVSHEIVLGSTHP
jgi:hypothetical protein